MLNGVQTYGAVFEKLVEFDRVATQLDMPETERLGILNVSRETYAVLRQGNPESFQRVKPEFMRRLTYALPLMRRLASTARPAPLPGDGSKTVKRLTVVSNR